MNKIYIVTKDVNILAVKKYFVHSGTIRWLFLAKDYRLMRQFEKKLGDKFANIVISDTLNQVADEIRMEHVEWIDSLNRSKSHQLSWWFGVVSSRNVYFSNLFLYSCYLIVLQRIWQNIETRPNLIVVDSPGLAECIKLWFGTNSTDVVVRKISSIKMFYRKIYPFLYYAKFLTVLVIRYFSALFTKIGSMPKKDKGSKVVVDTFVHDYSFSDNGVFIDRYFPFLHEFLKNNGYKVLVHPVLYGIRYDYISIFRRMRRSTTSFIIQEDYLKPSDYAVALLTPFTLRSMKIEHEHFRCINFSSVIKEEHLSQKPASVIQAILTYRLWNRLRQSGIELSWVISWYENQVIDKALIAGLHKAYPGTKIIGSQSFVHIPNYLSLYPSQSERETGFVPDLMLQMGLGQSKMALKYANDIPCRVAAALRYDHLFKEQNGSQNVPTFKESIVVLLPSFIDEALEILDILLDAIKVDSNENKFLIKCHPDYGADVNIIDIFGRERWPKEFSIWDGNVSVLFEKAVLVVGSNSSSMVEAAVLGIPVIFIRRQCNLSMNPLVDIPFASFVSCDNGVQLAHAIKQYCTMSLEERNSLIQKGLLLLNQYFTKVDKYSMNAFLLSEEVT